MLFQLRQFFRVQFHNVMCLVKRNGHLYKPLQIIKMQIAVSFRSDSHCIAITWQPLVGTGGMKQLLAASHLKEDPDCICSSFSNAVLWWYGVEPVDHAIGLLFHLEGVSLPDENGVFLCDPFSRVFSVWLIYSWFVLEWNRQKYMVKQFQVGNFSVL